MYGRQKDKTACFVAQNRKKIDEVAEKSPQQQLKVTRQ
jgi:hypothetical protein